ncbi:MAG: glycoside hydrolase family 1 protein, partial [Spirochaetales bacterium]|nr:glycoside hydrolase family 1 protein [Spirochaetales bacterium]
MNDETFTLPEDLLLGTATASLQIEGGDTNNSWYRWSSHPGHVKDGTNSLRSCDHWNRMDEDIALMKKLKVNAYRLSLEWSRLEPEEGSFSSSAYEHYRDELTKLKAAGIEPMVTLHHFSNPLWLEDNGGWTDSRVIGRFENFAEESARRLGDLVSLWATINEPNVYLHGGYLEGFWPPGKSSLSAFFKGAVNMIGAHIAAYKMIHTVRDALGYDGTMVGPVHHLRVFDPLSGKAGEKLACRLMDRFFHRLFTEGMATGKVLVPFA